MPNLKIPSVLRSNRASKYTHWLSVQILCKRKPLAHDEKLKLLHVHLVSVKVKCKVVLRIICEELEILTQRWRGEKDTRS